MTIDELIPLVDERGPKLAERDLAAFERRLGHPLPADYRAFLQRCNGGYLDGDYWAEPEPKTPGGEIGLSSFFGLRDDEPDLSFADVIECYQTPGRPRIPRELLPIADDPSGNAICIQISGDRPGSIWFWDHEDEPEPDEWDGSLAAAGNTHPVAPSFTAFVKSLRETPEE